MEIARVDPGALDASALGFRLGPRLNAAGRLQRADAGLELLLTTDAERARAVARELDAVNAERRDVETRIRFEAEALVAEAVRRRAAYVLASEGWHPGVIGIVAARIAERHHRPVVLIALDGEQGTGSGRSIPAFDLLAGLEAGAGELLRHGGHRAAAGLTIARERVDAFREAFTAHAAAVLTPEDLVPTQRIDAVVGRRRARARSRRGARAARAVRRRQPRAGAARARPRGSPTRGRWERAATWPSRSPPAARARAASPSARAAACPPPRTSPSTLRCAWRPTATTDPSSRGSSCATPGRARPAPVEVIGEPATLRRRRLDRARAVRRPSRPRIPGGAVAARPGARPTVVSAPRAAGAAELRGPSPPLRARLAARAAPRGRRSGAACSRTSCTPRDRGARGHRPRAPPRPHAAATASAASPCARGPRWRTLRSWPRPSARRRARPAGARRTARRLLDGLPGAGLDPPGLGRA